jgi:hypothetical protein
MNMKNIEKCAIVLSDDLGVGLALNAAAALALSLGHDFGASLIGDDIADASGTMHRGITRYPLPMLRAPSTAVRELVVRAHEADSIYVVTFSSAAQAARDYDSYREAMAEAETGEHDYAGLLVAGAKKDVNRLTGSLPLYR